MLRARAPTRSDASRTLRACHGIRHLCPNKRCSRGPGSSLCADRALWRPDRKARQPASSREARHRLQSYRRRPARARPEWDAGDRGEVSELGIVATVGIVSPGAMGSAVGAAYLGAGRRVVTTVVGRSERTRGFAAAAGVELRPNLDAVVAEADLVLSIVPPTRRSRSVPTSPPPQREPARGRSSPTGMQSHRRRRASSNESSRPLASSWSTDRSQADRRAPTTVRASTSPAPERPSSSGRPGWTSASSATRSASPRP
jgi:hypothetical protein